MLCRFVGTKKYRKRIFLITDGEKETKYNDQEFRQIVGTINENDIKLNCITLDFCNELAEDDEEDEEVGDQNQNARASTKKTEETENQQKNKQFLTSLQEQTQCAIIPVETALELYQQLKKKEYLAKTKFRGNLEISPELRVAVQIFTKTREESMPTLKKYSKNVQEDDSIEQGKVIQERTYTEIDDPDQKQIDESKHVKAYNYGKQLVPVSEENEHVLKHQKQAKKEESASQTPKGDEDIKMQ